MVVQSLCPPSAPRFCPPAAAGAGLKAQAKAVPRVRVPHVPVGGLASPGLRGAGAPADVGGHCLEATACSWPVTCKWPGGGMCRRGALCPRNVPNWGGLASSGARRGPGSELLADQHLPSCPSRPCVVRRWRPGTVPPPRVPQRVGGSGVGGWVLALGAGARRGSPSQPLGARPTGRPVDVLAFAHGALCCPRRRCRAASYGGVRGGWRSRALGAAVSGQWSAGPQCRTRPSAPCHRRPSTRPRPSPSACGLCGLRDQLLRLPPMYPAVRTVGGGGCRGGRPGPSVSSPPPPRRLGSKAPCRRSCRTSGRLSLAPPFAWGLGLRRWL